MMRTTNSPTDAGTGTVPAGRAEKVRRWLRRMGAAGVVFFAVKGLLWLVVPAIVAWAHCG